MKQGVAPSSVTTLRCPHGAPSVLRCALTPLLPIQPLPSFPYTAQSNSAVFCHTSGQRCDDAVLLIAHPCRCRGRNSPRADPPRLTLRRQSSVAAPLAASIVSLGVRVLHKAYPTVPPGR